MDFGIKGRTAIVAASSKGLGKAVANALGMEGVNLVICGRDPERLAAVASEIEEETGSTVLAIPGDLSRAADIENLFKSAEERFSAVDIVVANTGGPPYGGVDSLSDEDWYAAFELVQMSVIRLLRLALPGMRERKWGRVISIQSSSVKQPVPGLTLSNGIRPGVAGLLKSVMTEVASDGVTINTVLPGVILTDRIIEAQTVQAKEGGVSLDEQLELAATVIPAGRLGTPWEFAQLIAFLASENARYITGGVFQVDGGMIRSVV